MLFRSVKKSVFKRKIYEEIREWKENRSEKYALLVRGARRVGKSTIVQEFAKSEFKSYIMIDFAHTSKEIMRCFDDMYDLDFFFLRLQQFTGVRLYEKESVIIFDEVQLFPKARQAVKYLVADGRYKYIETGSLLSLRKNTKDILIPSEEHKISMYPMDFEEFLIALDKHSSGGYPPLLSGGIYGLPVLPGPVYDLQLKGSPREAYQGGSDRNLSTQRSGRKPVYYDE